MHPDEKRRREKLHPRETFYRGVGAVTEPRPRSIPWSLKEPTHPEMPFEPSTTWAALFDLRWNAAILCLGVAIVLVARSYGATWVVALIGGIAGSQVLGPFKTCRKAAVLRKRIVQAHFQLCPWCSHNLMGRPRDEMECPECGKFAPRREVVRFWGRHFRTYFTRMSDSSGINRRDFVLREPWRGAAYHAKA